MAIDITSESLLTLSAAARSLPGQPHVSTIHRWRLRGVRGIRLDTVLIGGIRYTSRQALQRFCERLTAATDGTAPTVRTPRQRREAIEAAEHELETA